jgi:hypothetical protein
VEGDERAALGNLENPARRVVVALAGRDVSGQSRPPGSARVEISSKSIGIHQGR